MIGWSLPAVRAGPQTTGCIAGTRSGDDVTAALKRSQVPRPEACLHPHNPAFRPCRVAHKLPWLGLKKVEKPIT